MTDPLPGGRGSTPASRRRRVLVLTIGGALLVAVGGFGASLLVKSPAQQLADSSAPPPSVITAPVESRVVAEQVVTRGQVVAAHTVSGIPTQPPAGVQRAVISRLPVKVGDTLEPGQVAVEVSGQPVFVLAGRVPAYRDLAPGSKGPDVAQLQRALAGAGHSVGADPAGSYGPGTTAAVAALYAAAGYRAPGRVKGAALPSSAVVFAAAFPVRAVEASAILGQDAASATLTLATGELQVVVSVQGQTAGLLRKGQQVALSSEVLGQEATGTVTSAAAATARGGGEPASGTTPPPTDPDTAATSDPESSATGRVLITPTKALPAAWSGQDVRVTIASASSGQKVLAVPVAAVSAGGDGNTSVVRVATSGEQTRVQVRVGVSGSGFVQITPVAGRLTAGDRVLVGKAAS